MPTPTQAQIEAWRDVIEQAMACIRGEIPEDVSFGEAEDDTFSKLRQVDAEMSAAITTAAEVGEAKLIDPIIAMQGNCDKEARLIAATIERCAQVVENIKLRPDATMDAHGAIDLAAAIRAMKDQP